MEGITLDTKIQQEKFNGCGRFFTLGVPNALISFAQAFTGIVLSDLIVYRTCQASQNVLHTNCTILRTNSDSPEAIALETSVEPYASMIIMTKSLIESILPAIISLFIGPWSDRGGRRPLILASLAGFILMYGGLSVMCNLDISPWYLVIPSLPAFIMGGQYTITLASNCYISDAMAPEDRTAFLAWLQTSISTGVTFGMVTGPIVYKNYGYTVVFSIAAACCLYALLHTYFFVPESVKNASKEPMHTIFQISCLKEMVTSCIKKREGFHRTIVWLGLFVFSISAMISLTELNLTFLFTRARLGWDVQDYSYLCSVGGVVSVTGSFAVSIIGSLLDLRDTRLAIISITSGLCAALTKAFTWKSWHMYLSVGIGIFHGVMGIILRSIISKFTPAQDVGKIFSLVAVLETLCPSGGATLFTLVYTRYLPPIYPCPVYLLIASILLLLIICVVCLEVLIRKSRQVIYVPAAQEDNIKS